MTGPHFGRMERVELRTVWQKEATEFTPWLAQEENIAFLGEAIGLDLEVQAQEANVGPFRADILCKDTVSGDFVLIENQLERTDHAHLGQLLTYAAGLQAVTVVWIAERFTDEHRAALDWLNEYTNERLSFFGLEVELWRIGSSPVAPKFNLACRPNDWTKAGAAVSGGDSPLKQAQLEYWTAFREYTKQRGTHLKIQKPLPQHWTNIAIGRSGVYLSASVNTPKKVIAVNLVLASSHAKAHFRQLQSQREEIEKGVGAVLLWRELPKRKQSRIGLATAGDALLREKWQEQHAWLLGALEVFSKVFAGRVKALEDEDVEDVQEPV